MGAQGVLRTLEGGHIAFECPGCDDWHVLRVRPTDRSPSWDFNGNYDAPTFAPSVLVTYPANPDAEEDFKEWRTERRCHSFVRDGKIEFLGDCTHDLKGQTVPLKRQED